MKRKYAACAGFILAMVITFLAGGFVTGKFAERGIVSEVVDGDTIKLRSGETVRLLGINAPERGQPYYEKAAERLRELVEHKEVWLERDVTNKDRYGRLLRYVFLNGENINVRLVREGLATVYIIPPNVKYTRELREAESEAKRLRINLWRFAEEKCDDRCIGISYFHWDAEGNDCENLNDEYVVFKNSCPYSCNLTGWSVEDSSSKKFVFPEVVLESGATITLYTGCGTNTNASLYWCNRNEKCNAVWNNRGDTLFLRNSKGELVLSYSYAG